MNVEIMTDKNDGYIFHVFHKNFQGRLRLGTPKSLVYIFSNGRILDHFTLYGFKGALKLSSTFIEQMDTNRSWSIKKFKKTLIPLKKIIYNILSKIVIVDPNFTIKHRHLIINILSKYNNLPKFIDPTVKWQIPVHITGIGLRKIQTLKNKEVYVTNTTKKHSITKAKLAANIGYQVICARTKTEKKFVENLLCAQDLSKLPNSKLKKIDPVVDLTKSEKQLLLNSIDVINSLISGKIFNIRSDPNNPEYEHDFPVEGRTQITVHSKCVISEDYHTSEKNEKKLKLGLCRLHREDINGLTRVNDGEIFLNLSSPIIKLMLNETGRTQKIMLLEELSHEFAHILGYGLNKHDLEFFKMQRVLKYKCLLEL